MFSEITLIDYARPMVARAKARKVCGPYKWRPCMPGKGVGFYMASKGFAMAPHGSTLRLRIEEANDHLMGSRLSNTVGYYCDRDGDGDTLQPVVARLPRGRGFLAGWTMGEGMCGTLDADIWPDEVSAAREPPASWRNAMPRLVVTRATTAKRTNSHARSNQMGNPARAS